MDDRSSSLPSFSEHRPHPLGRHHGASTRARTILWLACVAGAFTATHLPPSQAALPPLVSDTWLHLAGYAVLGGVTIWRLMGSTSPPRPFHPVRWYAALLGYALFDEVTQPLVGRSFEWSDLVADLLGGLLGMSAVRVVSRWLSPTQPQARPDSTAS